MGGTWRTKSMFDLDFPHKEKSFCQLLNESGIETFTFDIDHSSHQEVVTQCKELILNHKIKNIMGYSYGCLPAIDLSDIVGSIILLDPFSGVNIPHTIMEDSIFYSKADIIKIVESESNIDDNVKQLYYNSLEECVVRSFIFKKHVQNSYEEYTSPNKLKTIKCKTFIAFTNSSNQIMRNKHSIFKDVKYYKDASHWILIENSRVDLCRDIVERIK